MSGNNAAIQTPSFAALGLGQPLQDAAAALGWHTPTPIQTQVLPAILHGRDVQAQAPTGAGKTGAFLLPLLQRALLTPGLAQDRPRRLLLLVLAPTRELAVQTGLAAQALAPALKTVVAVGGLSINPQLMALRGGAHLLVATPGRLLDLARHNALRLDGLGALVLDEADRLLDGAFADETRQALALLPADRQTLLFSATWPTAVQALAQLAQHDALRVTVEGTPEAAALIAQRAIVVDSARRTALLKHLLATQGWRNALVFVATQHATDHVSAKLRQAGVVAAALHGQLSQGRRAKVLAGLRSGDIKALVATDLAARGLDVPQLAAVVNYDLPRAADDHIHRIGRTGRAGATGVAVSLVLADAPGSEAHFRLLEKRQALRVPREVLPGFEPAGGLPEPLPADPDGGVKGRRKSKKDKLREAAQAVKSSG